MSLDDVVLSLQRMMDRMIRWLRRGAAVDHTHPRLLIVQIDGLSRLVLAKALASGDMPFLAHLLDRHGYELSGMSVGLPTCTPTFQMATMYGVRPDIPGFHYYDRARKGDIHFPRPGHAAWVETRQASGARGILHRGSAYGCIFRQRPDWPAVVDGIIELMSMPSAGDLVIYGIDAPEGHVSFIPERGAHAGPSPEEMQTFIVHPATVTLPPRITHPMQLYEHFIRYRPDHRPA